ncbi:MAG: DeoR/GlpR transcriptional regulator [Firmicutes bacterium]|nr:DeoR/GlpR transcriptional regulator [Bacillota bacterium]
MIAIMLGSARRLAIIDILEQRGFVTVDELAREFSVSRETIRRDFRALRRQGLLEKVYGGATISARTAKEYTFADRETRRLPEKQAIAEAALQFIQLGDTVMMDASSTVLQLSKVIPEDMEISVITNALPVIEELASRPNVAITSTGGSLRRTSYSFVGPAAESNLAKLRANKAFISAKGVSIQHGLTEANPYEGRIKELMVNNASEVILLVDSSKLDRLALVQFAPIERANVVITDKAAPAEVVSKLQESGVRVIVAGSCS